MAKGETDRNLLVGAATAAFAEAPIFGDWANALGLLARAVGGWGCHLNSISAHKGLLTSVAGGIPEELIREFVAAGGTNPKVNVRVRAMYSAAPMRVTTEADFAIAREWTKTRYYREFAAQIDAPYSAMVKLKKDYDEISCISVLRSSGQGLATAQDKALFARIAPSIRDALRIQAALDRRALRLAAGSWDSTRAPAFYCNPHLKVLAMSRAGERLAEKGELLAVKRNHLRLAADRDHRQLARAVAAASRHFIDDVSDWTFEAADRGGNRPPRFIVSPISPERSETFMSSGALILVLGQPENSSAEGARPIRLTAAEQDIALQLLAGTKTSCIAEARGVSLLTIQTQIKVMHQKLGVTHRAELLAQLHRILSN